MFKKTIIILSCLLLLSDVICFAKGSQTKYFAEKTSQIIYIFTTPRNYNTERELLNEYHLSYGSKGKNHNDSWNISYDSDDKYFYYSLELLNDYNNLSFTQSINYTGTHSYGFTFGIAYNF
ncbi:hypothetical protein [Pectinatus frisingensis]|uniref:hypothetical protein n=1 Tax=Pectinatus frisingensis TaxID=865 RepID=UPI0018C47225|nr:hypothetical protein [Pectinatus frisingensis]